MTEAGTLPADLETKIDLLSRKLASKGVFKPLIDLRLGKPSEDSDPPTQVEPTYKATAGYYDDDGQEVVTEELTARPLEEEPPTLSAYQIPEKAASSSGSRTGSHADA